MRLTLSSLLFVGLFWLAVYNCINPALERDNARIETISAHNRKADLYRHVGNIAKFSTGKTFDCDGPSWPAGYREVCQHIGVNLLWMDTTNLIGQHDEYDDFKLGDTNGKRIRMFIPPCHPEAQFTFFHEVGHVLMNHPGRYVISHEMKEDEADEFASEVLYLLDSEMVEQ